MTLADGYSIAYRAKFSTSHTRLSLGFVYRWLRQDGTCEYRLADIRRVLRDLKRLQNFAGEVLS